MSGLMVDIAERGDATVVELVGAADLAGVETLQREMTKLCARKPAKVIFDLSQLSFISSICMGVLTSYRRACEGWKGKAVIAGAQPLVDQALRRARLDAVFEMQEEDGKR